MPNMTAISAAELASLRSDVAATLDLPCTIQRKVKTKDGSGRTSNTYNVVVTTKCGMAQPTASQLQNFASMIGSAATWLVRLPNGTDVRAQDLIVVSGQNVEVNVVLTPQSYSVLESVIATEVKGS